VIQGLPKQFEAFRDSIQDRMKDAKSFETLRSAANNRELIYAVDYEHRIYDLHHRLWLFSPFWIRTPKTWNGEDGWEGLIRHLFVQYEPPKFLYGEWYDESFPRFRWIVWFLLFSQGGSLKSAAKLFGWNMAGGFPLQLYQVPPEYSPVQACMIAEILRLGGRLETFQLLNYTFTVDPTEGGTPQFIDFWRDTIRWLSKKTDEIIQLRETEAFEYVDIAGPILDWALHKYTEAERENGVPFSWQGRQVRQAFEASQEYLLNVNTESERSLSWTSHGWDWDTTDEIGDKWAVVELSFGQALHDEGKRMHHCVGGYTGLCVAGNTSIFSLRFGGIGKVTIELEPKAKSIVQARGYCNQAIKRREHEVISQWLKDVVGSQPTELNDSI